MKILNKLIYLFLVIFFISCNTSYNTDKKYCYIDSISIYAGFKVSPEPIFIYYTDCNIKFSSKEKLSKNDSFKVIIKKWK